MLYTIIGMLVIILDQAVKFWVDKTINYVNPQIDLIPGVISLVRVQNDGAAFSFLAGGEARIWFIVLTLAFTVLVIIALATNFISGNFGRWCMVLVTAGGLSNMIDRVLFGLVIDMFKIELFDFAVFNVADIFITVFCIAFIIYILFGGEKEPDPDEDEFDEYDSEDEDRPKPQRRKKLKEPIYAEDEPEEEEEKPRKKAKKAPVSDDYGEVRPTRKKVRSQVSEDVEELFTEDSRAASARSKARSKASDEWQERTTPARTEAIDNDNPFAEWERANAKVRQQSGESEVAKAMATTTGARPVARKSTQQAEEAPIRKPAKKLTEEMPAKNTTKSTDTSDFDLDSIMSEFM